MRVRAEKTVPVLDMLGLMCLWDGPSEEVPQTLGHTGLALRRKFRDGNGD